MTSYVSVAFSVGLTSSSCFSGITSQLRLIILLEEILDTRNDFKHNIKVFISFSMALYKLGLTTLSFLCIIEIVRFMFINNVMHL